MTYQPGPLADARTLPEGDRWTLVFVRELRHPPERVWAALTRADELAGWVAERLLDGAPIPPIRGRDALNFGWQDLADAYAKRLA